VPDPGQPARAAMYFPPAALLMRALRITPARLDGTTRIGVPAAALKLLLMQMAALMPFDADFYRARNPDLAPLSDAGLHQHFFTHGWFEGRAGAPVPLDEAHYLAASPQARAALADGRVASAAEHFLAVGAAEGIAPNKAMEQQAALWRQVLAQADPLL
jgi:hypothetical protein